MRDPVTISTIVIAVATAANVLISYFLWKSTKDSVDIARKVFESANRPYVGVESLGMCVDATKHAANIEASIKNFGTASAENCDISWDIYIGGVLHPGIEIPSNSATLFPGHSAGLKGDLDGDLYDALMLGTAVLEIIVRVSYKWPGNEKYTYNEKHRYDPARNAFMNLGAVS